MARYVLMRSGGSADQDELDLIADWPGLEVLDRAGDRAWLVEVTEAGVNELRLRLPGWVIQRETELGPPRPRGEQPPRSG